MKVKITGAAAVAVMLAAGPTQAQTAERKTDCGYQAAVVAAVVCCFSSRVPWWQCRGGWMASKDLRRIFMCRLTFYGSYGSVS